MENPGNGKLRRRPSRVVHGPHAVDRIVAPSAQRKCTRQGLANKHKLAGGNV